MTSDESTTAVFEFCDVGSSGPQRDLLGLWSPVHHSRPDGGSSHLPQGAVAFSTLTTEDSTSSALASDAPVWRANFPDDREQISAQLKCAEQKLRASRSALAVTPDRLDAFLAQESSTLGHSFAIPEVVLPRPESELSALLLTDAQREGVMMSYDLGGPFAAKWAGARQALQAFAYQVQQISAGFAWVETRVAGRPVGWTRVTWSGDVHTVVTTQTAADRIRLHQRTLNLAMDSRRMTLRMSGLILAGAIKLTVMLSTGLGIVSAVPAMLHFIEEIRIEFDEYQHRKMEVYNV